MTGFTFGGCALPDPFFMAIRARYGPVFADQREIGFIVGNGIPAPLLRG
jgi:hypothetical protein